MKVLKTLVIGGVVAIVGAIGLVGQSQQVQAADCTTGTSPKHFTGTVSGRDTISIQTKGGLKLCDDVKVNFTTFKIHNTYNGQGFSNNPTALPQSSVYNQTVTLKKGTIGKKTVTMQVPNACTDYQLDAYLGPVQTKITTNEGLVGTNAIVAGLFQRTKQDCNPPVIVKNVDVCEIATKKRVMVKEGYDTTKYTTDFSKCEDTPPVETPVETPKETPVELPKTGPAEIFAQFLGVGSLVASAGYYMQSRRTS